MRLFAISAVVMAAAIAPVPVVAQTADWTKTVALTPEHGFRMGNPNAPVKLVEYASLTCPHCAHFTSDAAAPLTAHVRQGNVSYEFRNFVLNGVDLTATLLAHCAGAPRFFPMVEEAFSTQASWVTKISSLSDEERERLKTLPQGESLFALAKAGGLLGTASKHGVTQAKAKRCLADPALMGRLTALREAGTAAGVQGTPTFFINGQRIEGNEWPAVDLAIRRTLGERG